MAKAAVGILAGCEAVIAGFCLHDELAAMVVRGGMDAKPLEAIENVRRIRAVVAAGRFLDRAALDKILAKVKTAAQR